MRTLCPVYHQNRLREEQSGKCAYCNIYANAHILRKQELVYLQEEFDHFIPVSYGYTNRPNNWVLACNVCNSIKSDGIFRDVQHVRNVVNAVRARKGYENAHEYYYRVDVGLSYEIDVKSDTTAEEGRTRYTTLNTGANPGCTYPKCTDSDEWVLFGYPVCNAVKHRKWAQDQHKQTVERVRRRRVRKIKDLSTYA